MKLPSINMITQQEFCDHIEEDDFLLRYGNPVAVKTDEGKILHKMYWERRWRWRRLKIKTMKIQMDNFDKSAIWLVD